MNAYQHAAEKTRVWLDSHFDAAGDCVIDAADSQYYYKAPYLLTMAGLRSKGAWVAKHIPEFTQENRVYAMG